MAEDKQKGTDDWEAHKHKFEEKWLSINGTSEEIAKYKAGILRNSEFNAILKRPISPSIALRHGFNEMIDSIRNLSELYPEIKNTDVYRELMDYL